MKSAGSDPLWMCREQASESKKAWITALRQGCLSKSVNNKDVHYSHLKAVSARDLGKSNLYPDLSPEAASPSGRKGSGNLDDDELLNLSEAEKKFQPLLRSPVIFEDLTLPPAAIEEAVQNSFTLIELLDYLTSPDWSELVRLRVIGGDLLKILNASLISLEKRWLINLHSTSAHANNRVPAKTKVKSNILSIDGAGLTGAAAIWFKGRKKNEPAPTEAVEETPQAAIETPQPTSSKRTEGRRLSLSVGGVGGAAPPIKGKKKKEEETLPSEQPPAAADDTQQESTPADSESQKPPEPVNVKLPLPKPYEANAKFDYERLGLEIVFYEKAEKSNMPYVVPDFTNFDYFEEFPIPQPLKRNIDRVPLSYKVYKDQIRLPPYENIDQSKVIEDLQLDLQSAIELKERLAEEAKAAKAINAKDDGKKNKDFNKEVNKNAEPTQEELDFRKSAVIPDFEDVADSPYIERHESKTNTPINEQPTRAKEKPLISERDLSKFPTKPSDTPLVSQSRSRDDEIASLVSLDPTLMNISGSESGSFSSLPSSWADNDEELEEQWTQNEFSSRRLELTRHEKYISSIYEPREANKRPLKVQLETKKNARSTLQAKKAKEIFLAAQQRAKGDLYASFKHLARRRELQHRISSTHQNIESSPEERISEKNTITKSFESDLKKEMQDIHRKSLPSERGRDLYKKSEKDPRQEPLHNHHEVCGQYNKKENTSKQWDHYRILEDQCEMDLALKNDMEKRILDRLAKLEMVSKYKKFADVTDKGKGKNRSQNRNRNINHSRRAMPIKSYDSSKYPNYNLYLKINGKASAIKQPQMKKNIIQSSFCVNETENTYVVPQRARIGFKSPDQLINYLMSVRIAAIRDNPTPGYTEPRSAICHNPTLEHLRRKSAIRDNTTPEYLGSSSTEIVKDLEPTENNSDFNHNAITKKSMRIGRAIENDQPQQVASVLYYRNKTSHRVTESARQNKNRSAGSDEEQETRTYEPSESKVGIEQEEEYQSIRNDEVEDDVITAVNSDGNQSVAMSESQIIECALKCYVVDCTCDECQEQEEYLAHLRPPCQPMTQKTGCPPVLGKLRRDFGFLRYDKQDNTQRKVTRDSLGRLVLPQRHQVLDVIQVGDRLRDLMNDVMIRKETLSSSRGFTYTTITFTKRPKQFKCPNETELKI